MCLFSFRIFKLPNTEFGDDNNNSNCVLNTAPKTAGVIHVVIWRVLYLYL